MTLLNKDNLWQQLRSLQGNISASRVVHVKQTKKGEKRERKREREAERERCK